MIRFLLGDIVYKIIKYKLKKKGLSMLLILHDNKETIRYSDMFLYV